jgi:HlyD family secretion protein/epimerase transport system membrane fusion protein
VKAFIRRHLGAPQLEAPSAEFRPAGDSHPGEIIQLRLRRPIVAGSIVVLVLVFGLLIWASVFSIAGAVIAPGTVKVEDNIKQLKHREGGIVRAILVREGQRVHAGQVLLRLDRVQAQASVDIYQADYDSALAQIARFQAEAANASEIRFPQELLARQDDPRIAALLTSQRGLFQSRMTLYRSQSMVLSGQAEQLGTQIQGLRAQMTALDAQSELINDELSGVRDLNKQGYAPRTRLLELERSMVSLKGQRGSLVSDIARANQAIGSVRLQIAQLDDKRETDATQGLRDTEDKLTDTVPRLRAMQDSLFQADVRAPVDGYVFNLTQFTVGGVAAPGEALLDIVPVNMPLLITVQVKPSDIAEVHVGMPARVTLTAFNPRTTPQVDGHVVLVSADASSDQQSHQSFYVVQVKVDPGELAKAGKGIHLTPGMPATVAIVTGKRTIMQYLLGPMTEAMHTALRER